MKTQNHSDLVLRETHSEIEINGERYRKVEAISATDSLIRTYSAGVHVGQVIAGEGREVTLAPGAVRIWRWRGARTLTELATEGCHSAEQSGYTRVSAPSPGTITLTEAIEILAVTTTASESIRSAGWAE